MEVGAGVGNLCRYLLENNIQCSGIDISPIIVSYAQKRGLPIRLKNLLKIPGKNRYSAIVMSHVFEHLSEPAKMIKRINKLLKPRGIFLTVQPTARITTFLNRMIGLNNLKSESSSNLAYLNLNRWHIVIYSLKGMKLLTKRHRFVLKEIIPMPSLKSRGVLGIIRKFYNTFNLIGEIFYPKRWPFHVAHLFVFYKK